MTRNILDQLKRAPIVPLISAEDPDIVVETARALASGGLNVIEVVLRTDDALKCLRRRSIWCLTLSLVLAPC